MKKKQIRRTKTLWKPNGFNTTDDGNKLFRETADAIEIIYKRWLNKGVRPAEIREIMYCSVFTACTFANAMSHE